MAKKFNFYFRQQVADDEMRDADDALEQADLNLAVDHGLFGVAAGLGAAQRGLGANISVDLAVGAAYDQLGRRCALTALQNMPIGTTGTTDIGATTFLTGDAIIGTATDVASSGNQKIVSIFIKFARLLSEDRLDGNSIPLKYVRDESWQLVVTQGGEAPTNPTPPDLLSDAVLLCDVTRTFGQTQVLTADISFARTQYVYRLDTNGARTIKQRTGVAALLEMLGLYNDHVAGDDDKHAATAVTVAPRSNWIDTVANGSTDVQAALAKIITDLSLKATQGNTGASKVGAAAVTSVPNSLVAGSVETQLVSLLTQINSHLAASGAHASPQISHDASAVAWADGINHPGSTSVFTELNKIVADLGSDQGGLYVGAAAAGSGTYALTAGSVKSQINALRQFIDDLVAGEITYNGSGNWADGSNVGAGTVDGAIDEVVSDLGGSLGAQRVGVASVGSWNSNGASSGQVGDGTLTHIQEALTAIVSDLAEANGAGDAGANRIGAPAQTNGQSVSAGSIAQQINAMLGMFGTVAPAAHFHNASDINAGVLALGVIPSVLTGKDADTVDGLHASAFSLAGHNHDASYSLLGHNHDASYGRLAAANAWTAENTFNGAAGDQNAALVMDSAPSTRKLVHRIRASGTTFFRWYSTAVGLEMSFNARWDGANWQRDDGAIVSAKHTLFVGLFGPSFDVKHKAVGGAFSDAAWDASANMNTGGVTIGQDPATAYAALAGAVPTGTAQAQVGTSWNDKVAFAISSATLTPPAGYGGDAGVSTLLAGSFTLFGCQLNAILSGAAGSRFGFARYITTP